MDAATTTSRLPDARFLVSHPAHFIALGFGCGLAPVGPGTVGTAAAIPLYWALALVLPPLAIAFLAIPLFFVGIWASDVTARNMGVEDHARKLFGDGVTDLTARRQSPWLGRASASTAEAFRSSPHRAWSG